MDAPFVGEHAETALHWAASRDDVEAIDAPLDAGADVEAPGGSVGDGSRRCSMRRGRAVGGDGALVCRAGSVRTWQADFCPAANPFCDRGHLDAWREGAGGPPGRVASLAELAAEGRKVWAEMRPRRCRARCYPASTVSCRRWCSKCRVA